jgi:hypothetical protein
MLKIKRARPKAMFMGPVTLVRCDFKNQSEPENLWHFILTNFDINTMYIAIATKMEHQQNCWATF